MKKLSWKVMVAIAVVVIAIGTITELSQTAPLMKWQTAKSAPSDLMDQVVIDHINSDSAVDSSQMKVWKIQQAGQSMPLYLIDTRTANPAKSSEADPLCGALGCAFLGYVPSDDDYQQVLNIYLNPNLPPNVPLFERSESLHAGLPMLQVHQLERNHIQQLTLTFDGQRYKVTQAELLSQRYE